jgi:hypothetical protein
MSLSFPESGIWLKENNTDYTTKFGYEKNFVFAAYAGFYFCGCAE